MTAAWIATVIVCVAAFLYGMHLIKKNKTQ